MLALCHAAFEASDPASAQKFVDVYGANIY